MVVSACLAMAVSLAAEKLDPVRVELRSESGKWQLLRDGKPYFIKGAAGDHSLAALQDAGGNSTRTWGAEELPAKLAEAQRLGLTVTAGVWLGHRRHQFDYSNPAAVAKQFEEVRKAVVAHRKHPALLLWALGNEMEMDNDTPELWKAVGDLACMVKEHDPLHPVMTVVAEISESKIRNIQKYAPEVDVLGINSYGGLASLPERLKRAGWTKPYIVTEFGPLGPWESPRTEWGAAIEASSTEKARFYASNYDGSILGQPGWCLGSYAFLWGHKQETTPTWFGMFLPTGEAVGAMDEISYRWKGAWPQNRAPELASLQFDSRGKKLKPEAPLSVSVRASDPNGDPLTYTIEIRREVSAERPTGEGEVGPEKLPGYPITSSEKTLAFAAPRTPGAYRLYVFVRDGKGKAATANAPFFVG